MNKNMKVTIDENTKACRALTLAFYALHEATMNIRFNKNIKEPFEYIDKLDAIMNELIEINADVDSNYWEWHWKGKMMKVLDEIMAEDNKPME